ncbi:di-heme oxidoreductase family protein [Aestuariispira ectoiniformans]|uniref:di-heme oxidoreductase family protein n=1 Tax=Aestuariispira ectoiniformans TaxID=2775080 RepID=UPI00223AF7B9|nr:di-heme oxidoredictase family protein [Aestuariispira ectoiniformans]
MRQYFASVLFAAGLALTGLSAQAEVLPWPTDFAKAQPGEDSPGGEASHGKRSDRKAFSYPADNLPFDRRLDFKVGFGFFKRLWVSAPASTQAADGLGPLFNTRSCLRCHVGNGRGVVPKKGEEAASLFLRLSIPPQNDDDRRALASHRLSVIPDPVYGGQLQNLSIQGHRAEGKMGLSYTALPVRLKDGSVITLCKPHYAIENPAYGQPHPDLMISPRIASPMIGLGLLEAIPEEDLLALADPDDADGDGISGKPNKVWSRHMKKVAIGRFGWKAGNATVDDQNASAFSGDVGISSPLFPEGWGECTAAQKDCRAAPDGNSPQYDNVEASAQIMDLLLLYTRNIAVPRRVNAGDRQVLAGKKLFFDNGCAACHQPGYVTSATAENPYSRGQKIWPYTDLLLHDMGDDLADHRPEGEATGREWRTPPLWGLGQTALVSDGRESYLHDGRARTLLEAILWHGGEAENAKNNVVAMNKADRAALIAFLKSL